MKREEQITKQDLKDACDDLATLRYFPSDARASVMRELAAMCPSRDALWWLVREAVANAKEWPGLAGLRGLLCKRYDAADGIDQPYCSIPGYTPEEQEARYLAQNHKPTFTRSLAEEPRKTVKQLSAATTMPSLPVRVPVEVQRRPFQPLSASEIALLEAEACDERLPVEARARAQSLLEKLTATGAKA